ncbi:MAG: nicotinate-nucleotide adenylyltransferase [Halanaerobiaceae bacterium]
MSKRVAVLGGTFDPVHFGHLIMAEQAYNSFDLDEIIFIPSGKPPHKNHEHVSQAAHRLEMVRRAVGDNEHFSVSEWEIDRKEESYTVETLKYFENSYPGWHIYFLIGADSLYDVFNWKAPEYILGHANLIVVSRPGYSLENIYKDDRFRPYRQRINILEGILINISSSEIRKLYSEGNSIKYLVPREVEEYIIDHNLYRRD